MEGVFIQQEKDMRFKSYGHFKEVVAGYLNTKADDVLSKIPLWVSEVENNLEAIMRHPAALIVATYTMRLGAETIPAPSNLNEIAYMRIKGSKDNLYMEQYETLYQPPLGNNGEPTAFARRGRFYVLNAPVTGELVIEMAYYSAQPYLENDGDMNLWLAQCGDLMLYAVLDRAFSYIPQPEEAAMYKAKAGEALDMINNRIEREKRAGNSPILWGTQDKL